jgi:hypothetical protein
MAMIERLVKEKDPRVLTFSAEKQSGQSRSSLYKKLVNRKASTWGYNVKVTDDKLATKFELVKTVICLIAMYSLITIMK